MFLNYLSLALLLLGVTSVIYIFIYIHDIPHQIAKKRNHPQTEAIHYACWLSLFTLHALWPIVFIWAVSNTPKVKVMAQVEGEGASSQLEEQVQQLQQALAEVQSQLNKLSAEKGA